MTLPLIYTLKTCAPDEKDRIRKIIETRGSNEKAIQDILAVIKQYDGISAALNKAKSYIDEGKVSLASFENSEAKTALLTIADFIMERRI